MSGRRPVRKAPARRAPVRRRRRRRGNGEAKLLAAGVVVVVGVSLVIALVQWLLAHWWVLVLAGVLTAAAAAVWWQQQVQRRRWEAARAHGLRFQVAQLDTLGHAEFEHAVRDLMFRDGCRDAVRTGGRGDKGADVIATDPAGRRWVIQCKHRRDGLAGAAIGTPDLQRLNGTARPVHNADVVVMLTNGRFTRDAVPFGRDQQMHLVDRHMLARWAAGSWPLWELLPKVPPPRRPAR
ncbi:restriction endonuclease [Streptomyces oryzae]|uniref:Restriction endonuclease n=1 Tax=Streptomyces oryzae TaxID=1434886 RepID=A0ABS3X7K5_9ACTN|nr:restriction endonuclease [Streptomyces oryzae]MBO8191353.1 restriction endonuclease [Streptomyces oryzae]